MGGKHARTGTRRQARTRARTHACASKQKHADTHARMQHERTSACTQTHKRMNTNIQAGAHIRKLLGTPRRHQRAAGKDRRRPRAVRTRGSAADFGSCWFRLLLVCVPLASHVRRTRRCPQQTSAGSDVARSTAGSCAGACVCDGSHDRWISACAAALWSRARRQCCLSVVWAGYSASDGRAPAPGAGGRRLLRLNSSRC